MARTGEGEFALAVLLLVSRNHDQIVKFKQAYADIPKLINLTIEDLAPSIPRDGEPMWHQSVRNIQSHHTDDDNFINLGYLTHVTGVGYKTTSKGVTHLRQLGY